MSKAESEYMSWEVLKVFIEAQHKRGRGHMYDSAEYDEQLGSWPNIIRAAEDIDNES